MSSSKESMELGGGGRRRRGGAPKEGSVWESRMKLDKVKGGIKVFKAADQNSEQTTHTQNDVTETNSEIEICRDAKPKQSPNGKRKTWKSESSDGSPVKIAVLRSELCRNFDEQISESAKKSPVSIRNPSVRKANARASVGEKTEKSDGDDERERKSRSDEDCEEKQAAITSSVPQINGGDESDLNEDKEIEAENKSVDVEEIGVGDHKHKRNVIVEKKSVQRYPKPVPVSSSIARNQPPPAANHARFNSIPTKINNRSENFPRASSKLQSFVDLVMWRDVSKSAFVFGIGTFAIISSSFTKDLNISFISVLSYLGLVYLASNFLFRSLISRGSVENECTNQDCVIGEEEAIWVTKMLLPFINEFLLKLRALFSGDPSTTMKLAVLLFILARCGSSITIWTTAKLGFIGVFTLPKICSPYSSQITAYGRIWMKRFGEAWRSCSHKKAVGFGILALGWNLSSVVYRIWAVFMLFVAFKHYQQSFIAEGWAHHEAINGHHSSSQAPTATHQNRGKLKKEC
ncbi:reticulon-like protein B21 isoform X1 [Salvia splendens]|uniref:reticulon-like protein B21 isoform X1 n=1 Tax=Salvia splendens TaxID=180675 RepID=UPI0011028686|nr:reticulon-like protein B21 isoform X1 [Salvia splendens]